MERKQLRDIFGFLLTSGRFTDCIEEQGPRYRQVHFRSAKIVLRITDQDEITPRGMSATCLAFLVDPRNQNRWCMFERAVEVMLGSKVEGSASMAELQRNVGGYIDPILDLVAHGSEPPFEDFSRFA